VFFSVGPRGDVIASIPYAKYQSQRPTLLFFVRKKKLCEMHLHARREKTLSFAYHRGKAIEIIIFLYTLGKNLNPSGKKISAMGDFFSACVQCAITVALATMRFGN
jgi:hypothetical protein